MTSAIIVVIEQKEGVPTPPSLEVMTIARTLATQRGAAVVALVGGEGGSETASALGAYGADKIVTHPQDPTESGLWATAVADMARSHEPIAVLLPHTADGKNLGPRLAALLGAPMASDCVDLTADGETLVAKRPVYAGKAMITVAGKSHPLIATLRPNALTAQEQQGEGIVESGQSQEDTAPALAIVLKEILESAERKIDLAEASTIVSGGRGLKAPENFQMIEDLAAALGGAVGASRAVVDAGWRPHSEQVGQTGKTVSPRLYVAVAISGAIQHLAGMRTSKYIVAINKDPEAPIFKVADYGIVGDAFEVVPKMIEAVKNL
ncbi:MAG: electron transfer flavoprotein subunit alpha/FixB family protein [Planctomycetota bacterium]|nr:electron transfer flavoprotein subunit alpha/FixB family protein [Planctomycetota bacterium]